MLKEKWFYFVLLFSFVISLFLAFGVMHPFNEMGDAHGYDKIGFNLSTGKGFVYEENRPTMSREPAYPFFLAGIYSVAGRNHSVVRFVQIIFFLATVILTGKIAELVFDNRIARYAMILTVFFPVLANYPAYILSETLFTFLLSLFVFTCMKLYLENKLIYYVLSGFLLGALILCKSIMLFLIPVLFLWSILCRKNIVKAILMILIPVVMAVPWMYRNYVDFDMFTLREGSEGTLCVKVQKLDYGYEDFKKAIIFTISENIGKRIFPDAIENPRDFLFKEDILMREKIGPALKNAGYSDKEIGRMMIKKIMNRPLKFLAVSSLDLLKMMQFSYLPALNQLHIIENFNKFPHGSVLLSLLRAGFRFFGCILILFSIFGMYVKREMWKRWLFLFIIIAYITLIYSLIYGHGRYSVPIIPYYIILSSPAILKIKEWIFNKHAKI